MPRINVSMMRNRHEEKSEGGPEEKRPAKKGVSKPKGRGRSKGPAKKKAVKKKTAKKKK